MTRFLITSLSLAALWSGSLATKSQCGLDIDQMLSKNMELSKASVAMWANFEKSCEASGSCVMSQEPISATTHLNYIPMKSTEHYKSARQACKDLGTDEAPSALCHVNSELHVSNGETGSKLVTDKFFARREPACFPYQCSTNQGDIAHPNPLGCDPSTATCSVISMEVDCANRAEGAGTGNCKKYAAEFAANETLTSAIATLNADVGLECIDYKSDGDNDICVSTTDPIQMTVAMNMRKFEKEDVYTTFKDACYDNSGEVCYMSMTASIEGEIIFFNIDLSADYNDYPMCFPTDCEVEDRMEVHKEKIGKDIALKVSHSIKYGGRRLGEEMGLKFDERADTRSLQLDDEYCPVKGMDKCTILIADFYCTKREGGIISEVSKHSSASGIYLKSFVAAMAMAGGMLL